MEVLVSRADALARPSLRDALRNVAVVCRRHPYRSAGGVALILAAYAGVVVFMRTAVPASEFRHAPEVPIAVLAATASLLFLIAQSARFGNDRDAGRTPAG